MRFIAAGFRSITVAYRSSRRRNSRSSSQWRAITVRKLRLIVDSSTALAALRAVAQQMDYATSVFLKVDVGLHRVGVSPGGEALVELAQQVVDAPRLRFAGLLSHAGHAYAAADRAGVERIARQEAALLRHARGRLESAGITVQEVSVGSTPTVLASDCYEGITEIRPGNYVFMDRTPLRLGLIAAERIALTVLATVVSLNEQYVILDAGSKVLSSDRGPHGTGGEDGFGIAYPAEHFLEQDAPAPLEKLSEEHAFVSRLHWPVRVGDKVRMIPNHSCAVVNLADELVGLHGDGTIERWHVAARGAVH
jgi:D-serine deaminase-like pyridoxal phosphate-dependent protein